MKTRYDRDKLHRRSIRLKGYDYASPGAYFVTIVTYQRECLFENNLLRRVAEWNWKAMPRHFENVVLDEWIVMPNHLHGIIVITGEEDAPRARRGEAFVSTRFPQDQDWHIPTDLSEDQGLTNASPLPRIARDASPLPSDPPEHARGVPPGALGAIVGSFKSITTRRINTIRKTRGNTIWHRNYYEHIVRNEKEINRIREYIAANPSRWAYDRENANALIANDAWLASEKLWFSKRNLKTSND